LFAQSRDVELEDGRILTVQFQGERHGWGAFIAAGTGRPVSAATPAEAIVGFLGYVRAPAWVSELSERLLRDLADPFAPRSPQSDPPEGGEVSA